jgi:hypothetical protein
MSDPIKMEILRDCFVSDKSVVMRDGVAIERRKVFKGEIHDLHEDDAVMLDEAGLAKQVMERPKVKKASERDKASA